MFIIARANYINQFIGVISCGISAIICDIIININKDSFTFIEHDGIKAIAIIGSKYISIVFGIMGGGLLVRRLLMRRPFVWMENCVLGIAGTRIPILDVAKISPSDSHVDIFLLGGARRRFALRGLTLTPYEIAHAIRRLAAEHDGHIIN